MNGPCYCGDPECPRCGTLQGSYQPADGWCCLQCQAPIEPDPESGLLLCPACADRLEERLQDGPYYTGDELPW